MSMDTPSDTEDIAAELPTTLSADAVGSSVSFSSEEAEDTHVATAKHTATLEGVSYTITRELVAHEDDSPPVTITTTWLKDEQVLRESTETGTRQQFVSDANPETFEGFVCHCHYTPAPTDQLQSLLQYVIHQA